MVQAKRTKMQIPWGGSVSHGFKKEQGGQRGWGAGWHGRWSEQQGIREVRGILSSALLYCRHLGMSE